MEREIKDIYLYGEDWNRVTEELSCYFRHGMPKYYYIFIIAIAIGIMYDKRIAIEDSELKRTVPRTAIAKYGEPDISNLFQAAILTSTTVDYEEKDRLELAFSEKSDFPVMDFLTEFANFGATKLAEQIGDTHIETMENLKNFLMTTMEGNNFELDEISDDILLEE